MAPAGSAPVVDHASLAFPVGAKYGSVALTTGLRLPAVAAFRGTFAVLKDEDDEGEDGDESDAGGARADGAVDVAAATTVPAPAVDGTSVAEVKTESVSPVKTEEARLAKSEPVSSGQGLQAGGDDKGPVSVAVAGSGAGTSAGGVAPAGAQAGAGGSQRAGASVPGDSHALELVSESFVLVCSTEAGSLGLVKGYGDNRFGRFSLRGRCVW
jgi:hypothetical protein